MDKALQQQQQRRIDELATRVDALTASVEKLARQVAAAERARVEEMRAINNAMRLLTTQVEARSDGRGGGGGGGGGGRSCPLVRSFGPRPMPAMFWRKLTARIRRRRDWRRV